MPPFRSPAGDSAAPRRRRVASGLILLVVGMLAVVVSGAPRHQDPPPPVTCKPLPPWSVDIQAAGDGRWNLTLRNQGTSADAVVWMWSGTDAARRRLVWSGTLQQDELRQVTVTHVPAPDAAQVWAALEAAEQTWSLDAPAQRGFAVAAGPAAARQAAATTTPVIQEPSGRRVEQYVGQGGLR